MNQNWKITDIKKCIQTGATATVSTFATVVGHPNTPVKKAEKKCKCHENTCLMKLFQHFVAASNHYKYTCIHTKCQSPNIHSLTNICRKRWLQARLALLSLQTLNKCLPKKILSVFKTMKKICSDVEQFSFFSFLLPVSAFTVLSNSCVC